MSPIVIILSALSAIAGYVSFFVVSYLIDKRKDRQLEEYIKQQNDRFVDDYKNDPAEHTGRITRE